MENFEILNTFITNNSNPDYSVEKYYHIGRLREYEYRDTRIRNVKVRCLNTGKVYMSVKEACQENNTHSNDVRKSFKHVKYLYSAGKDEFGNKLYWERA